MKFEDHHQKLETLKSEKDLLNEKYMNKTSPLLTKENFDQAKIE